MALLIIMSVSAVTNTALSHPQAECRSPSRTPVFLVDEGDDEVLYIPIATSAGDPRCSPIA